MTNKTMDAGMQMMQPRTIIITGGAGGAGHRVTQRWLESGASVLVADHAQTALDQLRNALPQEILSGLATVAADVTTEDGASRMVAEASKTFGRHADTLIHLVGGFATGPLDASDASRTWDRMIALNLTAAFQCYRAMLPGLKARQGGWIVGLGARAATEPRGDIAAYAASKAGLTALTQSLSAEVRPIGIHVNLVLASTIDTPANRAAMGTSHASDWVTPDDIADATLYLCSDRARAVYGATLELYANA